MYEIEVYANLGWASCSMDEESFVGVQFWKKKSAGFMILK